MRPRSSGPRVVLRADGGHAVGAGHVMRMVALADAVTGAGGEAVLLIGGEAGPLRDHLSTRRIATIPDDEVGPAPSREDDVATIARHAAATGAELVVLDGPSFTATHVDALTARGLRVAWVDDTATAPLPAPIVINHNLGAEELAARYPDARHRLLGRAFHLLRQEFRRQTAGGAAIRARGRRVLVTMGGSDPAGATTRVIGALGRPALDLHVVLGPGFRCDDELARALARAEARGHTIHVHYRPPGLPGIMAACDLAITAAGGTLGELGYLGRPAVAIAIAPDQIENARRHVAHGLACLGRPLAEVSDAELDDAVHGLLADLPRRRELRARNAGLLDGRGATRVLERLVA